MGIAYRLFLIIFLSLRTQNSENSVIYSNSGSTVGLYNREMATENIYQIQSENEYEQWH